MNKKCRFNARRSQVGCAHNATSRARCNRILLMNVVRIRSTRVKIVTKSRVTCTRTESGRKEGRKEAREALLNFSRSNPSVTRVVYVVGTKTMRHDEGAKKNRWWPTERERAGLLPKGASSSRSIADVLVYLCIATRCYFHRWVSTIFLV